MSNRFRDPIGPRNSAPARRTNLSRIRRVEARVLGLTLIAAAGFIVGYHVGENNAAPTTEAVCATKAAHVYAAQSFEGVEGECFYTFKARELALNYGVTPEGYRIQEAS